MLLAINLLILMILDLQTLLRSDSIGSFEVVAVAVHNNLCCRGRKDVELDTEVGAETRKGLFWEFVVVFVFRALQVVVTPGFARSLWIEQVEILKSQLHSDFT
jgi:hypothetical protein